MSRTSSGVARTARIRLVREPYGWPALLVAGGLLSLAAPAFSSPLDVLPWVAVQGLSALAVVAGIRRHGLGDRWPWRLLAAGSVTNWLTTVLVWAVGWVWLEIPGAMRLYNGLVVVCYSFALLALVLLSREHSESPRAALLDSSIITVGVTMPFWAFFVDPLLGRSAFSGVELAFALATSVIDLFLFGLVTRMGLARGRAPWLLLLGGAQGALFTADGLRLLDLAAGRPSGPGTTAAWLLASVLVGAAALHPSTADGAPVSSDVSTRVRGVAFLALALLGPLTAGAGLLLT
ncbi:hypothetical protein ACFOWE_32890, partial [Planomonospora corallina]